MDKRTQVEIIMRATNLAYSYERYGKKAWKKSVRLLLSNFSELEVVWILYSKNMRWAADNFEENGKKLKGDEIIRYLNKYPQEVNYIKGLCGSDEMLSYLDKITEVKSIVLKEKMIQKLPINKQGNNVKIKI